MNRSFLTLAILMTSATARADIPPPEGYVESCTVPIQSEGGRQCRACATYHGNPPTYCGEQVGPGLTRVCRTRGASAWTEVWCRDPGEAPAPTTTMDEVPAPAPAPAMEDAPAPAMREASMATNAGTPPPSARTESEDCAAGHGPRGMSLPLIVIAGLAFTARRRRITP